MGLGESRMIAEFPDEMGERKSACGVEKELEGRFGGRITFGFAGGLVEEVEVGGRTSGYPTNALARDASVVHCGFAVSVELVTRAKTGSFASLEVLNGPSTTEELFLRFRRELSPPL